MTEKCISSIKNKYDNRHIKGISQNNISAIFNRGGFNMGKLSAEQQAYLEEKFKNRLTFDHTERKLYGHDIAAMPSLVKPLLGNTTPEAVVQPASEEELIDLDGLTSRRFRWYREVKPHQDMEAQSRSERVSLLISIV